MQSYRFRILAALAVLALFACDGPMQPDAAEPGGPGAPEAGPVFGTYLDTSSYVVGAASTSGGALLFAPAAIGEGFSAFTSRDDFEAAVTGLVLEGFEDAVPESGGRTCESSFDSTTDNECFAPGGIVEGVRLTSFRGRLSVIRPGMIPEVNTTVVGPAGWPDTTEIAFTDEGGVTAFGLDLLAPAGGPAPTLVELFGLEGELVATTTAQVGGVQRLFWGLTSDTPIASVVFTPGEDVGLLLANLAFRAAETTGDPGREELEESENGDLVVDVRQRTINPRSQGVIPVAVLSTEDFDATSLDPATVRFGPLGAEPAGGEGKAADLNDDGLPDLLFHFPTPETGLACGDVEAELTGETTEGQAVRGVGEVQVLCPPIPAQGLELRSRGGRGG